MHLHTTVSDHTELLGISDPNAYIPHLIIINVLDTPIPSPKFILDNSLWRLCAKARLDG